MINKLFAQIDQFQYVPCSKQSHQQQPLSIVCVDKNCSKRSLLCIYCEENHEKHETVPLKQYLKRNYATIHTELQSNNILNLTSVVEELQQNYIGEFEEIKNKFCQSIEEIITSAKLYFSRIGSELIKLINSEKHLQGIVNMHTEESRRPDKIVKGMENFLINGFYDEQEEKVKIFEKLEYIVDGFKADYDANCLKLSKIRSTFNQQLKLMHQDFQKPIQTFPIFLKLNWSPILKGNNMQINGFRVERTNMISNQRFALCDRSLQPFLKRRKKVQWFFKITKLSSWIGIGIALKNKMAQVNYNFNYTSLGHGSYLLSSNGYTWSHSIQADNSSFKSFYFTTNDIVKIQVDPTEWKVNFYNMGKKSVPTKAKMKSINTYEKKFSLSIEENTTDEYYPCVNLCSTNDSVQIING